MINELNGAGILCENERLDRVNDDIALIQRHDGLTFGTDALLLASYIEKGARCALEIGGGTGIISLLCLSREKFRNVVCCEIQEVFADIIERNARLNGLEDRLRVECCDIRNFTAQKQFDAVFTNPPYMKSTGGKANESAGKNIARHEIYGDIGDFCASVRKNLKFGGKFYAVYRPDRISDLIFAMKSCGVEPKRLTFVHADADSIPSMVLVEGRMGGGDGAKVTKPLLIYTDKTHKTESADMRYILEKGSFPDAFSVRKQGDANG